MARKRRFEEMLDTKNRYNRGIDYTENLPATASFLSTPKPTDSLVETCDKVERLAAIVRRGKSLAIHTKNATPQRDAITDAKETMTALEIEQYEAYIHGDIVPTIEWVKAQGPPMIPYGLEDSRRAVQCLHAAREICRNLQINPHATSQFIANFPWAMPLINAVMKVQAMQQKYVDDQINRTETEMDLVEVNTTRSIVTVAMNTLADEQQRVSEEQRRVDRLAAKIRMACEVIQDREDAIQSQGEY
ncbi:uncharacterized protein N7518_003792 [Penicillium psychrosexuale]|uniref:uncharacterized protein n=1 Tax=Penicillium psychrosexuale TaxID=1002107 RepID=UPI002544FFA3|nr:uncharacterized protein N7518_003792 [Penicillium psychrosexuale]KAJ5801724.1 hypothetical protein N7518_003792 [Penicillium psychrosexuale]